MPIDQNIINDSRPLLSSNSAMETEWFMRSWSGAVWLCVNRFYKGAASKSKVVYTADWT